MPRKCCVPLCNTNYKTGTSGKTFRFPANKNEQEVWKTAIPRKRSSFQVTKNTVVCEKHWPANFDTYVHYGKERPVDPPSIFSDIPVSFISSQSKRRKTRKSLCQNRSIIPDQIDEFNSSDTLVYEEIMERAVSSIEGVTAFEEGVKKSIIIQSTSMNGGIPTFVLEIQQSLKYKAYRKGVLCCITSLSRNNIRKIYLS